MARLAATDRADLPDRAFAYVDTKGRRKLPLHDEAHVRNALARFGQVAFEDEAARQRARARVLTAAKRHGIVPVGFINAQLQSERLLAEERAKAPPALPTGFVTMLMTDIEGSTALVQSLGERYRDLITEVRSVLTAGVVEAGGVVAETRADEFFAVSERPGPALEAAVAIQRELRTRRWDGAHDVRVRIGIHSGEPTVAHENYIGLPIHATARICAAAHGGQILVSGEHREAVRGECPPGVRFRDLGLHRLRGLPEAVSLYQVMGRGLAAAFPPPRTVTSRP